MANSRNDLKAAVDNKNAPQIAAQTKRVEHTTKNNTIK